MEFIFLYLTFSKKLPAIETNKNSMAMISEYITYLLTAIAADFNCCENILVFFKHNNNRSLENWFFFSSYALYNSRSDKSRKSKLFQNRLTCIYYFNCCNRYSSVYFISQYILALSKNMIIQCKAHYIS